MLKDLKSPVDDISDNIQVLEMKLDELNKVSSSTKDQLAQLKIQMKKELANLGASHGGMQSPSIGVNLRDYR